MAVQCAGALSDFWTEGEQFTFYSYALKTNEFPCLLKEVITLRRAKLVPCVAKSQKFITTISPY